MLKPNYALDFQPICTFFPWGEGIEDTEPQPCLGFSANLSLPPAEEGLRIPKLQLFRDFQPILSPLPA